METGRRVQSGGAFVVLKVGSTFTCLLENEVVRGKLKIQERSGDNCRNKVLRKHEVMRSRTQRGLAFA